MQKLINVLALLSFGTSAAIVGTGAYVYLNKDALIEQAKAEVTKQITAGLSGAVLGGGVEALIPSSGAGGSESLPIPPLSLPF